MVQGFIWKSLQHWSSYHKIIKSLDQVLSILIYFEVAHVCCVPTTTTCSIDVQFFSEVAQLVYISAKKIKWRLKEENHVEICQIQHQKGR